MTIVGPPEARPADGLAIDFVVSPIVPNWVRSSSEFGTDDCGPTSATSRPSTMLSPPSTRPSEATGRRSSAFVHKDSETMRARRRLWAHRQLLTSHRVASKQECYAVCGGVQKAFQTRSLGELAWGSPTAARRQIQQPHPLRQVARCDGCQCVGGLSLPCAREPPGEHETNAGCAER